ncbi:MAG TPA: glycogen-binding domain-containing protein, partial [Gemmatimonadaceae bacterium]|nr:glycogen-binding domain-containing protein [Gemmatimonadaceae bacterium]
MTARSTTVVAAAVVGATAAALALGVPRSVAAQGAVSVESVVRAGAGTAAGVASRADGVLTSPAFGGGGAFRVLLNATADRPAAGSAVRDRLVGGARLSYTPAAGRFGLWAGVDVARARLLGGGVSSFEIFPSPRSTGSSSAPDSTDPGKMLPPAVTEQRMVAALGLWWQRRSAVLSLSLMSGNEGTAGHSARYERRTIIDSLFSDSGWVRIPHDSSVLIEPARAGHSRGIGDAEARLAWGAGRRVVLDGALGARFLAGGPPTRTAWGGVDASVAVAPFAALVVGGGVRPTALASRLLRERYASAGVRLSASRLFGHPRYPVPVQSSSPPSSDDDAASMAAAFDVRAVGGGRYAVHVRIPGAREVELSGDFTGWQPVPLARVGATDGWELVLPLEPGTHHVNIRVDGAAWVAPPGASTVDDDFNGTVGVVVVP